jgi:hypothetical protein
VAIICVEIDSVEYTDRVYPRFFDDGSFQIFNFMRYNFEDLKRAINKRHMRCYKETAEFGNLEFTLQRYSRIRFIVYNKQSMFGFLHGYIDLNQSIFEAIEERDVRLDIVACKRYTIRRQLTE